MKNSSFLFQIKKSCILYYMKEKVQEEKIQWRAAEQENSKKEVSWYWLVILTSGALILLALWQKNFFFATFVVLATVTLLLFGRRRAKTFEFSISEKGIAIGEGLFYDYDQLESFAMRRRPNHLDEIVLKRRVVINPHLRLPIATELGERAEAFLEKKLEKLEYEESLMDILGERFGF